MALDFGAGCVGGAAGVIVGQPFDTVKVRLQVQHKDNVKYKGVLDCVIKIIQQESFTSLYKGMTPPLMGLCLQNALIFGLQGQFRKLTEGNEGSSLKSEVLSGAITGAVQAYITGPIELAKIKLQLQGAGCERKYTGPIQTIMKIRQEEGIRGCFRGSLGVFGRDIPGTAMYFGSFAYINSLLVADDESGTDSLGTMHLLFSGGCAGMLSWAANYPIDVVKTRIQAEGIAPHGIYTSYSDCIVKCLKADGFKAFFQGFGATMLRAFPVNAAILSTVTLFIRYANKLQES